MTSSHKLQLKPAPATEDLIIQALETHDELTKAELVTITQRGATAVERKLAQLRRHGILHARPTRKPQSNYWLWSLKDRY